MAWSSSVRNVSLLFAATAMLFCGCSGSDGDSGMAGTRGSAGTGGMPDGRVLETGLFGTVVDASGQPIEGVTVTVNEISATTNADGEFVIETSVTGSTVARFRASGYLPTVRKLAIAEGSPTAAHVTLKPRALATSMSADIGGTAMGDRQAEVTIEPGDLTGPNGSSVTGMIDVSITPVDPSLQDEVQALTGSFDDGVSLLESFGMAFITIMQGNVELQVAVGESLVIVIPAPSGAAPNDLPDTMPLWSLNQNTGQWEEEGTLTLDEQSNAFVGEVDRMASWNADVPATSTCITGLAVDDEEGDPIAGAEVDTTGLDYFGSSTGSTGDDGRFDIPVRKSSQVLVSVSHAAEGGASREVMSGAEDTALPPTPGDARCSDIGTFTVRREIVIVPEPTTGGTGGSGGVGGSGGTAGLGGTGGFGGGTGGADSDCYWSTPVLLETDDADAGGSLAANYEGPQVAVDANGNATAVWSQVDGTFYSIYANRSSAGGPWGGPVLLETGDAGDAIDPQVAVDPSGNVTAVWRQWDGAHFNIHANRYPAGGPWGGPVLLETDDVGNVLAPQLAVDPNGNVTVVWAQWNGAVYDVHANRSLAGGPWGTPVLLETDDGGNALHPQVAVDPNGNVTAVWSQEPDGRISNVYANHYPAGGPWGNPVLLETLDMGNGFEPDAFGPQVAVDPDGNATAVWAQSSATSTGFSTSIYANHYPAGGPWGSPVLLETAEGGAGSPDMAVDRNGNVTAVWQQLDGGRYDMYANHYPAGGPWGSPVLLETDDAGSVDESPQVAVDSNGNVTAVWAQSDGTIYSIYANRYPADGPWGSPVLLETDDAGDALEPQLAVDPNGEVTAVWAQFDGTADSVYAARWRCSAELCDNSIDDDGDTLIDCGDPECCVQMQCETSSTCFSGGAIATGPFTYEGQPGGSFSYVVNFSTGSVTMYGVPVDWPGGEVGHSGQLQGDLSADVTFTSGGESTMGTVQYTCLDVPTCNADTPTSSRVEITGTGLSLPTFPDAVPGAGGITYDTFGTGTCLFGDPPTTPCSGSVTVYPRPTF